jgi:hypothetical protein
MLFDFAQLFPHSSHMTFDSSTITIDVWEDCVTHWEHPKLILEQSTYTWAQSIIIWEQSNETWEERVAAVL